MDDRIVTAVEPAEWDKLLCEFPQRTIFHSLAWLNTVSRVRGARVVLAQAHVDGRVEAVWPCLEMRKGPLRVLGSPLPGSSTAYMGPLFRPGASGTDVNAALTAFFRHKPFRKQAYFACKALNTGPYIDLAPFGFVQSQQFDTYCLDLTLSEEVLWSNLKSECRTRIRKARKVEIEVREETTPDFLDEYWTMSVETFANTNMQPTFTRQFLDELWRRLFPLSHIRALSAWRDGERIAVLMLPFDSHTMYYWGGAAYARFRALPAHNLLHWHAIGLAQGLGLRCYDFVSSRGGAGRFKKTFGPTLVTAAIHWGRTQSRLMAALNNQYQRYLLARRRIKS